MYLSDTIAAVSTPVGEGGIAVIRISGPDSLSTLISLFKRKHDGGFQSHRFYYGNIISPESGIVLDEAMCVYMQGPRSFTREDVVEIQCHGGTIIIQQILALVLRQGVRLAEPGEFTRRAFLNGRIDLLQAEAVIDLIRGKTESAVAVARQQSDGALTETLTLIRGHIRQSLALVEAYVDFPDEDMGEIDSTIFLSQINSALSLAESLIASFEEGKVIREGVSVLIAGKPNVGKSSLLNSLLREKRAIVTSVPGTTRDLIEEVINVNGLPVKLLDTAGIRTTVDPVECEGVKIALARIPTADLLLYVLDSSQPFDQDDRFVADSLAGLNTLIVFNKSDLPRQIDLPPDLELLPSIPLSTATGHGLDELKVQIAALFLHGKSVDSREYLFLTRARHRDALQAACSVLRNIKVMPDCFMHVELVAVDLRDALDLVGQITGETTPDDILDLIFGQFCIGK